MNGLRQYLTAVKNMDFVIEDSLQQQIQADFVLMRQMNPDKVTANELHSLLTLARLMSQSMGQKHLSIETWDRVVKMEAERVSRQEPSSP